MLKVFILQHAAPLASSRVDRKRLRSALEIHKKMQQMDAPMVKVRDDYPVTASGDVDTTLWLARICDKAKLDQTAHDWLRQGMAMSSAAEQSCDTAENSWANSASSFYTGLEMAEILATLHLDVEALMAALLYRAVREGKLTLTHVRDTFGEPVSHLIDGVLRMAAISAARNLAPETVLGQPSHQLQNLRKMLVAMVDDARVALIKLAERTCAIRAVKDASDTKRRRVASEVGDIYAPLAQRLGIGHIKWELEDLSFRYLQPDAYKRIATLLDEKRLERDQYITDVVSALKQALAAQDIQAQVSGRAKHIYSIWHKMQRKGVDFHNIYDIRAVRVLVPRVTDCYATLGIVHGMWQHIAKEFDDYIASPKDNAYRSLHTAVLGPGGRVLEVQIRTHDMHEEAELGVCAHWQYKDDTPKARARNTQSYEEKIAWLRQVLEWQEELGTANIGDVIRQFQQETTEERVYVFTPEGHVVELAAGGTPLDFAYHVHTEVGHHCRGAKVNGRIVPLTYRLVTGEQVEILTARNGFPSHDWLNPILGYVKTSRARAKIQHWFKQQDRDQNILDGRAIIERELARLSIPNIPWLDIAERLNKRSEDDVYASVGAGDLSMSQVFSALQDRLPTASWRTASGLVEETAIPVVRPHSKTASSDLSIAGVDNLSMQMAGCCYPVPGDPVAGYITMGRGVTVHRTDCRELDLLREQNAERVVDLDWGQQTENVYVMKVFIKSCDRQGLLRDISTTLSNERVNVINVQTASDKRSQTASMYLTVEIKTLQQLAVVLERIQQLPGIIEVRRTV